MRVVLPKDDGAIEGETGSAEGHLPLQCFTSYSTGFVLRFPFETCGKAIVFCLYVALARASMS